MCSSAGRPRDAARPLPPMFSPARRVTPPALLLTHSLNVNSHVKVIICELPIYNVADTSCDKPLLFFFSPTALCTTEVLRFLSYDLIKTITQEDFLLGGGKSLTHV